MNTSVHRYICQKCRLFITEQYKSKTLFDERKNKFIYGNKIATQSIANAIRPSSKVSYVFELMSTERCYSITAITKNNLEDLYNSIKNITLDFNTNL